MRVLVTRPIDDAQETAAQLASRGHEAIIAPLLEIRYAEGPDIALDGVQGVLATSSNGVRALARRTSRRNVSIFAVGTHTAAIARELGFQRVRDAGGDAHGQPCQGIPSPLEGEGGTHRAAMGG